MDCWQETGHGGLSPDPICCCRVPAQGSRSFTATCPFAVKVKSNQLPAGACNSFSPPPVPASHCSRWEHPATCSGVFAPLGPPPHEANAELFLRPSFGSEVKGRGRGESADCHREGGEERVAVSRGSLRTAPGLTFLTHSKRRTAST